jgi:amino acid transporter
MMIVTGFYLGTNFVIIGTVDEVTLASSPAPLTVAAARIFSSPPSLSQIGSLIVGVGALVSIMGADESGTIGTSRLAFAMSIDGLLPRAFSRLHSSYHTPYIGLILLCTTALAASVIGTLSALINSSVFLLSFTYLATCISAIVLERKYPRRSPRNTGRIVVPALGIAFSILLMSQVDWQEILISLILLAIGVPMYVFFTPKKELHDLREAFLARNAILERAYDQGDRFLAHGLRHIKLLVYRRKGGEKAWSVEEEPPPGSN